MADLREFEAGLMRKLSRKDIDKTFLQNASKAIVEMKKLGLEIDGAFPKGKIYYDRFIINGIIDPELFGKFKSFGGKFTRFEVFPVGIINPEIFRFQGEIGM
jgi:hypothetical protein